MPTKPSDEQELASSQTFYLDESGNTGDLSRTGYDLDFGGQPVFSLAAVGLLSEAELTIHLEALRAKHKVQSSELKLSKILKRKPEFALDAMKLIADQRLPFFVEVVDKKYQLAVSITNGFVCPPYFDAEESQKSVWLKNIFADYIWHRAPNEVLFGFVQCMDNPSNEKTRAFFSVLEDCFSAHKHEVAQGIVEMLQHSKDDFRLMVEDEAEEAFRRFLPLPDAGKRGQEVWMLPNFSSFANIYARVNLYRGGALEGCRLVHDEQAHFDEIVAVAKAQAEAFKAKESGFKPPHSDYNFKQIATLLFQASSDSPGIQLSDLVAGLAMRWYLSYLHGEADSSVLNEAVAVLLRCSDPSRGTGINLVAPLDRAEQLFGVRR